MNAEQFRYRAEANATAICLVFSAVCFGVGIVLQRAGRAIDHATTWSTK